MEISVEPPCVNRSQARFTVSEGRILYALGALKGVGVEAMALVVRARAEGPFADLFEFARRVELKALGKRALEMLASAGALDALERNRRRVFESLDRLIEYSAAHHAEKASGQASLFGGGGGSGGGEGLPPPRLAAVEDWLPSDRLGQEHAAIGFYLSGHPLDLYADALARKRVVTYAAFLAKAGRHGGGGRIAGTLGAMQVRKSARGNRFAYLQFSDVSGGYEVMAFSDVLMEAEPMLVPGASLVLTVETEGEDQGGRVMLRGVAPIESVTGAAERLRVYVHEEAAMASIAKRLEIGQSTATLARQGTGAVSLVLALAELGQEVEVELDGRFPVGAEIRGMLKAVPGVDAVEEV